MLSSYIYIIIMARGIEMYVNGSKPLTVHVNVQNTQSTLLARPEYMALIVLYLK